MNRLKLSTIIIWFIWKGNPLFGKKREQEQDARIKLLEASVARLADRVAHLENLAAPKPRATRAKKS